MMMETKLIFILTTSTLIIMYTFNKYHIFNNLIICEYIVVTVLLLLFFVLKVLQVENYMVMFVLVILITESVLGLSLMVNLVRTHSSDFMKTMTMMKF